MSRLFSYSILGTTLHLRVDDASQLPLAEALHSSSRQSIIDCAKDTPAELVWKKNASGQHILTVTGESEGDIVTEAILFFLSEHRLTQLFAERLSGHLQLHAATVIDPEGNGWLICGPSRAGKTSLTLAFILSGWNWLSDEYAIFRQEEPTTVLGFPRNFNLKESSFPIFPETAGLPHTVEFRSEGRQMQVRFFDPLDVSPQSWRPQAPLKGLIFPRWNPDAKEPQIRAVTGMPAVQTLLGETACWQPWALEVLPSICQRLPALEFTYANARDNASLIRHMKQATA